MGEVYEVEDQWLRQNVAMKTLLASIADDDSALARLKAEVLLARRISHPNVCRVFDLGFGEKRFAGPGAAAERVAFLTMELLRGETLKARVRRAGRLGLDEARPLVAQMIAGLARAHAAGIVHRDFKSDNVMLVADGEQGESRLVVSDFGLARSLVVAPESLTSRGHHALGTLDYMAPEQLEGKSATRQSDVYAFGVVLFEMLTGELPFRGSSPLARALLRVKSEAPRVSQLVPGFDPVWENLIARCLERDSGERCEDLNELLPLVEPAAATRRRVTSSVRIWLAVALAVGLAGTVAFRSGGTRREEGQALAMTRGAIPTASSTRAIPRSSAASLRADVETLAAPPSASTTASAPLTSAWHAPIRSGPAVSSRRRAAPHASAVANRLLDPFGPR
jgi:serine/threonine protein kinase